MSLYFLLDCTIEHAATIKWINFHFGDLSGLLLYSVICSGSTDAVSVDVHPMIRMMVLVLMFIAVLMHCQLWLLYIKLTKSDCFFFYSQVIQLVKQCMALKRNFSFIKAVHNLCVCVVFIVLSMYIGMYHVKSVLLERMVDTIRLTIRYTVLVHFCCYYSSLFLQCMVRYINCVIN